MSLILQDTNGILWNVTANDATGLLDIVQIGSGSAPAFFMNDPTIQTTWLIGVTTAGLLTVTAQAFQTPFPVQVQISPNWSFQVTASGLPQTVKTPAAPVIVQKAHYGSDGMSVFGNTI